MARSDFVYALLRTTDSRLSPPKSGSRLPQSKAQNDLAARPSLKVHCVDAMIIPNTQFPAERILLGPGPSPVPQRVLRALGAPTLGHLDPQYLAIMDETCEFLRQIFRTKNA